MLVNDTFYNNTAVAGGAIYNAMGGMTTLDSCTIVGNIAMTFGAGGGIFNEDSTMPVLLHNTIIAGNRSGQDAPLPDDIEGLVNVASDYNLIGYDPNNVTGLAGVGHNLVGTSAAINPQLGPLQDNGGPDLPLGFRPLTFALLSGSPALNSGDPALSLLPVTDLRRADERGVVRIQGAAVNIGAYQATPNRFTIDVPSTVTAGTPFQVTVTAYDQYTAYDLQHNPLGPLVAVGYTGTVHFVASNGATANYTFTASGPNPDYGHHTFNVAIRRAQTQFTVTGTDTVDSSITGRTIPFNITPAAAASLAFVQPPTGTMAGHTISPAVMVAVVDAYGNVETGDNSTMVTLSIGHNPSGGMLHGTLAMTVSGGIATFTDLSIDLAGDGYTLHATVMGTALTGDSLGFRII
jgi:hypothetical protein